jgi:hypothetical protein
MMTFKQFLQEGTELGELAVLMALRKEFSLSLEHAKELLAWLHNDESEMYDDIYSKLGARFSSEIRGNHPSQLPSLLQGATISLLHNKYHLSLNEGTGDRPLLAGVIDSLLKKGEKVAAWAEVWDQDPKKMKPKMYPVVKVADAKVYMLIGQKVQTWFELNPDDDVFGEMYFKKEGDTWVVAEPKRKYIRA